MLLNLHLGVGERSSLSILAEVGDVPRFKVPKSLVSYTGLCFDVYTYIYQSDSTERTVKSSAANKWLKWNHLRVFWTSNWIRPAS